MLSTTPQSPGLQLVTDLTEPPVQPLSQITLPQRTHSMTLRPSTMSHRYAHASIASVLVEPKIVLQAKNHKEW